MFERLHQAPLLDPTAYVAESAVLAGAVTIGRETRVLHQAVLTADGGTVAIGDHCVIMEGAVLRGTRRHPLTIGNHVIVGPHAYLCGCRVEDEVFVATNAMVFNGAVVGRTSSIALGGAVHIGCRLPQGTHVPIGWVAVGNPAELHPPEDVDEIRGGLRAAGSFLPYVFGVADTGDRGDLMREATELYARYLGSFRDDRRLS